MTTIIAVARAQTARASRRPSAITASAPPAPPQASADPTPPKGKLGLLVALLSRPEGATVHDLGAATGWQLHSVRGAMAGALKKAGFIITSEKTETGRIYRIASEAA